MYASAIAHTKQDHAAITRWVMEHCPLVGISTARADHGKILFVFRGLSEDIVQPTKFALQIFHDDVDAFLKRELAMAG